MSVEDKNSIDLISIDDNDNVVLTISDHLEWDDENEHLLILQDKINLYLDSIESGDLIKNYPKSRGKKKVIRIIALHQPNKDGLIFLQRVKNLLESYNYGFIFLQSDQ
jgi:hypothetical protein